MAQRSYRICHSLKIVPSTRMLQGEVCCHFDIATTHIYCNNPYRLVFKLIYFFSCFFFSCQISIFHVSVQVFEILKNQSNMVCVLCAYEYQHFKFLKLINQRIWCVSSACEYQCFRLLKLINQSSMTCGLVHVNVSVLGF